MPRHRQKKSSAPGGSQRQLRVGETVRHAVADILSHGDVHDPDLEGHIITVPEVRMSPDLKLATIYVMPLGGRDTEIVIAALDRNKKFLRTPAVQRDLAPDSDDE
jgi:ribosome-binding factor A